MSGLAVRMVTCSTCCSWACLMGSGFYGWTLLYLMLLIQFTHNVKKLILVWWLRVQMNNSEHNYRAGCEVHDLFVVTHWGIKKDMKTCLRQNYIKTTSNKPSQNYVILLKLSISSFKQLKTNCLRTRQEEDIIHKLILGWQFCCNPGPGKHLCSYAMIKSKLNLVPSGKILQGTPRSSKIGSSNSNPRKGKWVIEAVS